MKFWRVVSALAVFTLIASACGDDEEAALDDSVADAALAQAQADADAEQLAAAEAAAAEAALEAAMAEAEDAVAPDVTAEFEAELEAAQADAVEASDRAALVALYNATDGPNWGMLTRNWLSDKPLAEWDGVTTDSTGRVTGLSLRSYDLRGPIPTAFSNLTELRHLDLGYNDIPDISFLAGLTNLTSLDLTEVRGSLTLGAEERSPLDISPLATLTNLRDLNLRQNKLSDLSPLTGLTDLTSLNLGVANIRWNESDTTVLDLSPLAALVNLRDLDLSYNNISDISPLTGLSKLVSLDISTNHISDLRPLVGLNNLMHLNGTDNSIVDVSPLAELDALQTLIIPTNAVSDIAPLATGAALGEGSTVDISTNPLSTESIVEHIPALRDRGVRVTYSETLIFTEPQIHNDNVFVLPVSDSLSQGNLPIESYAARFYDYFNDEFDFLIFVSNVAPGQLERDEFKQAVYIDVRNDVQGIGKRTFAHNDRWGSKNRLQGVVHMSEYAIYFERSDVSILVEGPALHELMHRWANSIVPAGKDPGHWGFSSANGNLGGFDMADLVDHGGNRYSAGHFGLAGVADNVDPYGPLELYLAGLIPAEEVPDLWVAEDGEWLHDEVGEIVRAADGAPIFSATRVTTYTIEDIVAEHGARVPNAMRSQKDFRAAVILLVDPDHPATPESLETLSNGASWLSQPADDGTHRYNFYEATGGRATLTMDGLSRFLRSTGD